MKILKLLLALGTIFLSINAFAKDVDESKIYQDTVKNFLDSVYKDLPSKKNYKEVQAYFKNKIPEYFAVEYIAAWSLGQYSKQLNSNADLKSEYVNTFISYISLYYGSMFNRYYQSYKYNVTGAEKKGEGEFLVSMSIQQVKPIKDAVNNNTMENVVIKWRVRYSKKDNKPYIVDIILDDISLLNSQRADFEAKIKSVKGDLPTFITFLQNKVAELEKSNS